MEAQFNKFDIEMKAELAASKIRRDIYEKEVSKLSLEELTAAILSDVPVRAKEFYDMLPQSAKDQVRESVAHHLPGEETVFEFAKRMGLSSDILEATGDTEKLLSLSQEDRLGAVEQAKSVTAKHEEEQKRLRSIEDDSQRIGFSGEKSWTPTEAMEKLNNVIDQLSNPPAIPPGHHWMPDYSLMGRILKSQFARGEYDVNGAGVKPYQWVFHLAPVV